METDSMETDSMAASHRIGGLNIEPEKKRTAGSLKGFLIYMVPQAIPFIPTRVIPNVEPLLV
jgi:hypothetical protein